MARQLEAVYEHGILRPLEPLIFPEHQRVHLTLEEVPARLSWVSTSTTIRVTMKASWSPVVLRAGAIQVPVAASVDTGASFFLCQSSRD